MGRQSRRKRARHRQPPPKGTRVFVNGVVCFVNSAPLAGTWSSGYRGTRVARHTADRFVLAPSWASYVFGSLLIIFGGPVGFAAMLGIVKWLRGLLPPPSRHTPPGWAMLLFLAMACVFLWLGLRTVTRVTRFDRTAGRMTSRRLWRTTEDRPLSDILAVQCLYAGVKSSGGPRGGGVWHEYQLNVAIKGEPGGRVNVRGEPSGPWVRATAVALAEFLGVPLVDHFDATLAPCDRPAGEGVLRRLWNWCRGRRKPGTPARPAG